MNFLLKNHLAYINRLANISNMSRAVCKNYYGIQNNLSTIKGQCF